MGLSFRDENSSVDRVGSLRFASTDSNRIPETSSIGHQERPERDLEDIEIQLSVGSDISRDKVDSHLSG